jgi:hypothetical protein
VWTRRRLARPGGGASDWPTLSKHALAGEGFDVIGRRQPSLLLDRSILITGEVDRTTDFEHGMPRPTSTGPGTTWEPDPLILDDQALAAHVRGQGLVIVTGCGHAGAVNIVRHAQRLTGVPRLHALVAAVIAAEVLGLDGPSDQIVCQRRSHHSNLPATPHAARSSPGPVQSGSYQAHPSPAWTADRPVVHQLPPIGPTPRRSQSCHYGMQRAVGP